jgi:hypothetical protein
MQELARPTKKARSGVVTGSGGYTFAEVQAALQTSRYEIFRHELHRIVAGQWSVVADLTKKIETPMTIHYDRFGRSFMRSADFRLIEDGTVSWSTDAIRSFWLLRMPDGNFAEWMMGTFYVPSPDITLQTPSVPAGTAFDALINLVQAKLGDWLTIPSTNPQGYAAGDPVGWAITLISQRYPLAGISIPPTTARVAATAPKMYEPDAAVIDVVNDLMLFCGYRQLRANITGSYVTEPYVRPSQRALEYTYTANNRSVLVRRSGKLSQDLFAAPNEWVRVVSRPDRPALRSKYTLSDPANVLSTTYRGRTVTDYKAVDVADQTVLDDLVKQHAEEGQLISKTLEVDTPIMPHDHADKIAINYPTQAWGARANGQYIERAWSFECRSGARMRHILETVPDTVPT